MANCGLTKNGLDRPPEWPIFGGMNSAIKNETRIRREVALAEKQDGVIVSYDEPVTCDCCGKLCTVRYFEMTNGARFGKECATVFQLAYDHSRVTPVSMDWLRFMSANKKQIAYMVATC